MRDRGRHRQVAGREPLAEAHEVGTDAGLLTREQRAGSAEPGRDLVADEQDVVGAARFGELGQTFGVGELHARSALHERLDDHCGKFGCVRFDHSARGTDAIGLGEVGGAQHREAQRVEHGGAEAAVTERERADRVAVVGPAEREERRAAGDTAIHPVLERDLQRLLNGRGAVRRVEKVRVVDRHDRGQCLGKLDDDAVAVAEHRRMRAPAELLAHGVVELGNAMSERRDP